MEKEFKELCEKINNCKNTKDLYEMLDNWKIEPVKMNDWIEVILHNLYLITPQVLPYVIECLFANPDKIKFFISNILLEETYETLPFITNLENIKLGMGKFKSFIPTIVNVVTKCYNGIADCMYLIILNNDPKGELFNEEERNKIILSIEDKLSQIYNFINNNTEIPREVYSALEILLDVACNFTSEKIMENIREISTLTNLDSMCKIFLTKVSLVNNLECSNKFINELSDDYEYLARFYKVLKSIGKEECFPKDKLIQENFAKSNMIDWLSYPTELGKSPKEINCIGTFEEAEQRFYIFEFTSDGTFEENGKMLGIAGGYSLNSFDDEPSGYTFSKFEKVEQDYKKQAREIYEMICNHWKSRVEGM